MQEKLSKKVKKIIITVVVIVFALSIYQVSFGKRIFLPVWLIDSIQELISREEIFSVEPYKDGTIILVKPVATGVGDGRYEAGDIVEIRDGQEMFERFGVDKNFLGEMEKTKLLPLYYDGKLTEEMKQKLLEPVVEALDPSEYYIVDTGEQKREDAESDGKIIKRRQIGVDYTNFLTNGEMRKARNEDKALKTLPEIDLTDFIEKMENQLSVVEVSPALARTESFHSFMNSITQRIIHPVLAQAVSESIIDPDNGSGTDYLSLNSWEGTEQSDLTSGNEIALATCRSTGGTADTSSLDISGWTTDATRYIKIWTDPDESYRHDGKWKSNAYRINYSSSQRVIRPYVSNVKIDGLQLQNTGTGSATIYLASAITNIEISNNIIISGGGTGSSGILINDSGIEAKIWNTVIYEPDAQGDYTQGIYNLDSSAVEVYNITVYNFNDGIEVDAGTLTVENSAVFGNGTDFDGTMTLDNNASDDVTGSNAVNISPGGTEADDWDDIFVDYANGDFHLQGLDTTLKDAGDDLSAQGFSDDVDGDTRPYNSVWDIGADERNCADDWWSCQWTYRRKITLDNSGQSSAFTDFPAGVHLNSSRIDYSNTQDLGQDIRFVDGNGSVEVLQYEIEQWNESGTSTVWVKVPNIASASSTDHIWMYYGNTNATTTATTTGVWDANFVMVQHMKDATASTISGSTLNNFTGTKSSSNNPDQVTGKVGSAEDFDANAELISYPDDIDWTWTPVTQGRSTSFWLKSSSYPNVDAEYQIFFELDDNSGNKSQWLLYNNSGTMIMFNMIRNSSWSGVGYYYTLWSPNADTWYYVTFNSAGEGDCEIYIDGEVQSTTEVNWGDTNTAINPDGISNSNAIQVDDNYQMDEFRFSNMTRSADWVAFEYCNMTEGCNTYGSEETLLVGGNTAPTITSVSTSTDPIPAGQDIYWSVDWNDVDSGDMVKVQVCTTDSITTGACTVATWCSSPVFTNRDPEGLCYYRTDTGDIGANDYYAFVCDDDNDCSASDSGLFNVAEQSPAAPSDLLLQQMPNPTNIASTTPTFSAMFNDPNTIDIANKYCIHVNTSSDFTGTDMWISDGAGCGTGTAMTNCVQGNRCEDVFYNGTALSLDQSVYYWRINFWDDSNNLSASSTTGNWTMSNGSSGESQGTKLQGGRLNGGVRLQ